MNMLSMAQIFNILNQQSETKRQFGKVAVELGYLTDVQINQLLFIQKDERPQVGEILVEMGVLDRQTMEAELKNFQADKKQLDE